MNPQHPPMRWALIGASTIAKQWMVDALRATGDEVVAVVSGSLPHAQAFAQEKSIAHALTKLQDLKALDIDAVYISSTNEKHEEQTLFAAAQGWHVLCEKPLATDFDAALRMVQACKNAGVVMGTNHHLRHNSAHRQMRELVRAGALGRLVAARVHHAVYLPTHLQGWRLTDKAAGGGVVLDIAVHNADSLAFILGAYPSHVTAMVSNTGMAQGMEDHALSLWRYDSGLLATTHQGFSTPHANTGLELHGTEGSLHGERIVHQAPGGRLTWRKADGEQELVLDGANLYERGIQEFHRAVRGEPHDMATGEAGLRSLAVALAVLESASSGRTVAVRKV
jgi:1,5-anhydro-D-fructose reductase (1,5-anhydro-D-mannitol-forming)